MNSTLWRNIAIAIGSVLLSVVAWGITGFENKGRDHEDRLRKLEDAFSSVREDGRATKETLNRIFDLLEAWDGAPTPAERARAEAGRRR